MLNQVLLKNERGGVKIPSLCFGTGIVHSYHNENSDFFHTIKYWGRNFLKNHRQLKADLSICNIIDAAMKAGNVCFDTSRAYGGAEFILGKQLRKYNRDSYFVITKLCNQDQYKGNIKEAFEKSLHELSMDYIDLYLMHWPVRSCYIDSWLQMEELYKKGMCRAIGVCNCNIHHLEEILRVCNIKPMVNQFECHPLFTQTKLREYCRKNEIQVMAYTSTGRMDERLWKTALLPIAKKYNKTLPQVILRWHQQIGNIPIVNSANINHFMENMNIYDFNLTEEEINMIFSININSRLRYDPDNCDFSQL